MKSKTINTALLLLAVTFTINSSIAFAAPDMNGRNMGDRPNPNMRPEGGMGVRNDLRVRISSSTEQRLGERREMRDMRASSTDKMMEKREERREDRREDRNASTSEMFKKMLNKKQDTLKKMKRDTFEIRKNALVKELTMSLKNLGNIRDRINTRIVNIESGSTSMTEAKAALATADDKLSKAKTAIDALVSITATSTTASTASTTEIDLSKPRQVGDAAIKAVKDARDSLRDVVKLIEPPKMIKDGEQKDIKENK